METLQISPINMISINLHSFGYHNSTLDLNFIKLKVNFRIVTVVFKLQQGIKTNVGAWQNTFLLSWLQVIAIVTKAL